MVRQATTTRATAAQFELKKFGNRRRPLSNYSTVASLRAAATSSLRRMFASFASAANTVNTTMIKARAEIAGVMP